VHKEDWTQNYDPGRTSYTPFSSDKSEERHVTWTTWRQNSKITIKY